MRVDRLQGKGRTGGELVGAVIGACLLTVVAVVCCVVTCRILHRKRHRDTSTGSSEYCSELQRPVAKIRRTRMQCTNPLPPLSSPPVYPLPFLYSTPFNPSLFPSLLPHAFLFLSRSGLGRLSAWHLPDGPVGPPARWAATSNVEWVSGTQGRPMGPPLRSFDILAPYKLAYYYY